MFEEFAPLTTILLVSGAFSFLAILTSKISRFLKSPKQKLSSYESGFDSSANYMAFRSEKLEIVNMYLNLELIVILMLFFVDAYFVTGGLIFKFVLKVLTCFLSVLLVACNRSSSKF